MLPRRNIWNCFLSTKTVRFTLIDGGKYYTLNDKELNAIQMIVNFGGYVTSMILGLYIKDCDRHLRRILSALEEEKLLRRVEISRNPSVHNVFQVTKKACVIRVWTPRNTRPHAVNG